MNEIFLSYKRSDEAGYVKTLTDSLHDKFGEGMVYRDVDSNIAGTNWKKTIARAVSGAEIVLAVIGPKWQELITGSSSRERDWVRYELNQANDLDVPIIPVRVAGAGFIDKDLGELNWLTDLQFFELADGQGRWEADIDRLAGDISKRTQLEVIEKAQKKASSISQSSTGDGSHNIVSSGPVTLNYGKDSD